MLGLFILRGFAGDSTRIPTVEYEYLLFSDSDSDIIEPESTAESHHFMIDILSVSSGPPSQFIRSCPALHFDHIVRAYQPFPDG